MLNTRKYRKKYGKIYGKINKTKYWKGGADYVVPFQSKDGATQAASVQALINQQHANSTTHGGKNKRTNKRTNKRRMKRK